MASWSFELIKLKIICFVILVYILLCYTGCANISHALPTVKGRMLYLFNQLQFISNTADSNEICTLAFCLASSYKITTLGKFFKFNHSVSNSVFLRVFMAKLQIMCYPVANYKAKCSRLIWVCKIYLPTNLVFDFCVGLSRIDHFFVTICLEMGH